MTEGPGPFEIPGLDGLMDSVFGGHKPEKGLPWEAKIINDKYYVPLSQVVELLAQNNVLPAVRRGLENRIRLQAEFVAKKKE